MDIQKNWTPIDVDEFKIFLSLVVLMGIIRKPTTQTYWTKDELLSTPIFIKIMHRDRFLSIKTNLHFSNKKKKKNDKLFKINKIQLYLKKKFKTTIDPERDLSLDESLMLFKGRLGWKQYLTLKRSRFGIKIYMIFESNSGYVWDFIIYTGHGTKYNKIYNNLPVTSQVVMTLSHPY